MNGPVIPPPIPAPPLPRKKRRWWVYLLLALGGLFVLGVLTVVLLAFYAKSLFDNYTSKEPVPIKRIQFDRDAQKQLQKDWEEFQKAVLSGKETRPFRITADDMNLMMSRNPWMREHVNFVITNGELKARFSMPMRGMGPPQLRDRFLNGFATIDIAFQDGWLTVSVGKVEVNGRPAPNWALGQLRGQNFLQQFDRDRNFVGLMQEIDSITITNDAILITPLRR
ncbi:MAG: hypothetical protein HZA90_18870 [Verrucomicrobia bacterium]|nr:hypothetical protein [Verrucomicrobiota bacterium]